MTMRYQSYARWNPEDVPSGALNSQNETTDEHDTEAGAQAVVNLLKRNGFAGEGRVFPIEGGVRLCSH